MAVAPKLPNLAPSDMAWIRWVTSQLGTHDTHIGQLTTKVQAANTQRGSVASAGAKANSNAANNPFQTAIPSGLPQTPTQPSLFSDHGTVTIRWDGTMNTNGVISTPAYGFDYVTVQRSSDNGASFVTVANRLGIAGTAVDTDVIVGNTYFYRFVTTDTLDRSSDPSLISSIVVKGVDLGSLDQDVLDALDDIRHSASTGGLVYYGGAAPTDPSYHNSAALWFDTSDPNGAVPRRWNADTLSWDAIPYGEGALGPGSITASKILAGAIDTYHLGAGIITTEKLEAAAVTVDKLQAASVTTEKVAANAIDANKIAAGAIDARHLQVTAAPTLGNPVDRIPAAVTNVAYWTNVTGKTMPGFRYVGGTTPTVSGLVLNGKNAAGTAFGSYMSITAKNVPAPASGKINLQYTVSGNVSVFVYALLADLSTSVGPATPIPAGEYSLPVGAAYYDVYAVNTTDTAGTLLSAHVFEVIGSGSQQHAELSPAGLRLFNDGGQLSVDLTTATTNFFTIVNAGDAVLTLDEDGNGSFNAVQANDDFYYGSDALVDRFAILTRADGPMDGPIMMRLPFGVHYAATWQSMDSVVVNSRYQRIATGSFQLHTDRTYMINVDLGGLQTTDTSGFNLYVELQLSTSMLTDVTTGVPVMRSVVYNTNNGYFTLSPAVFTTPAGAAFDLDGRTLPAQTDIYWQINTNLSSNPTGSYKFNQYTNSAGLTVIDMGPSITVFDGTDRTTTGATATGSAGSGSGGGSGSGTSGGGSSTTAATTKTWNASWSASWNQGGSNKVTGTGQYTDADRLYQGFGASNMGAKFGFPASVQSTLAGKTITKVEVFLQNRWTYNNAGGTATFAGHGSTSAGATFGSTTGGTFDRAFDRGQGRWLTIGNTEVPFSSWKSGNVRGLALVVEGGASNYAYYDGADKTKPPKLRITYK